AAAEVQADMNTPVGQSADTQPPTAPSNLAATPPSGSQIDLTWTAATDNIGVARYLIERCQGAACATFTQVATSTRNSFSSTGLAPTPATPSRSARPTPPI